MAPQRLVIAYVLALTMALGCASQTSPPPATTGNLDWHPKLDQPIRQLEEVLAATEQQQPRNYASANLGFVLDAKLFLLFERYVASVPAADRPAIVDEQRQWLEKRKRATDEAYAEYEGGTFASFAGNNAFIDATKARIDGLEARHQSWWQPVQECVHPVVRTHPESGRKAIFVNGIFTKEIVGLPPDESAALIAELCEHATRDEFTVRHDWHAGDIAFWDNRCTQHRVDADFLPARRRGHRIAIDDYRYLAPSLGPF